MLPLIKLLNIIALSVTENPNYVVLFGVYNSSAGERGCVKCNLD